MRKVGVLVLLLVSVGMAGLAFHQYETSGREVVRFPIAGAGEGAAPPVMLSRAQSPVRVILSVRYRVDLVADQNEAYGYQVSVKGPAGRTVLSGDGRNVVSREDRGSGFVTDRQNHVIGTFPVETEGAYLAEWSLSPRSGQVLEARLMVRENVAPISISKLTVAAICFVLAGLMLFAGRKRA
ncbi:hypothetical protein [Sneathiella chinensis]|uniref:CopC domain-containing protein n=1 Tax=Sneathiella chinensis TaxID=349750 RepID=A0ABQ5U0D2_9PROT|nr:hypothetical protein [Sneathiella chinensis]GLQ05572.1 hypothetical protein GCM10007924_07930 [Sneathiella chinensis]